MNRIKNEKVTMMISTEKTLVKRKKTKKLTSQTTHC